MTLFSKHPDDIQWQDIEDFCSSKIPENFCLDYKRGLSDKDANLQIGKLATAFSNSLGGLILVGIRETQLPDGRGVPERIEGVTDSASVEKKINEICLSGISPPVFPEVKSVPCKDDPSRAVVIVRIPQSDSGPHSLRSDGIIYVRMQDSSKRLNDGQPAAPDQIEWLLHRRKESVEFRERLLSRAEERTPVSRVLKRFSFDLFPNDSNKESESPPKYFEDAVSIAAIPLFPNKDEIHKQEKLQELLFDCQMLQDGITLNHASDSIYTVVDESVGSDWTYTSYFELNRYGLLYYASQARQPLQLSSATDSSQWSVNAYQFLSDLQIFLKGAAQLFEAAGYLGLVHFEISAKGVKGFRLATHSRIVEWELHGPGCIDDRFKIKRTLEASALSKAETAVDLYKEFNWAFGRSDLTDELAVRHLEQITSVEDRVLRHKYRHGRFQGV